MAYAAKIVCDSVNTIGNRLTTMEVTFPRIVLAEFNTHRMLSRNAASSRAIPVEKQMGRVEADPFYPVYWGKNQKGMQADEELSPEIIILAEAEWAEAREDELRHARNLLALGVHKQIANRRLEADSWVTDVVSATDWSNFFALRCSPQAQPEIRVIAEMMRDLYVSGFPQLLGAGAWHLPYIQEEDSYNLATDAKVPLEYLKKASAARCARVSYLTQDGRRSLSADIELYDRLASSGHLSPLEHVATQNLEMRLRTVPMVDRYGSNERIEWLPVRSGNFLGWKQLRKFIVNEDDFGKVSQ